jgi:ACS family tartrate transporter-like MFS transporter
MLANSAHSDRTGERAMHCIVPCLLMGAAFLVAGSTRVPWLVVLSLGITFMASTSILCPGVSIPTQFLAGRAAAAGIAAMNTITMFSGFVGPYVMGLLKDATGDYQTALRVMLIPCLAAAGLMYALMRSLARPRVIPARALDVADETA